MSLDYHYTNAATLTTSWQSGAFSRSCSYFFFILQSCHPITIISLFYSSYYLVTCEEKKAPALLRFLRPTFLSLQCVSVKQKEVSARSLHLWYWIYILNHWLVLKPLRRKFKEITNFHQSQLSLTLKKIFGIGCMKKWRTCIQKWRDAYRKSNIQ